MKKAKMEEVKKRASNMQIGRKRNMDDNNEGPNNDNMDELSRITEQENSMDVS